MFVLGAIQKASCCLEDFILCNNYTVFDGSYHNIFTESNGERLKNIVALKVEKSITCSMNMH